MLLFSTILPARADLDPVRFFETIIEWNQKSQFSINRIEPLEWNGQLSGRYASGPLELILDSLPEEGLYGARFVKNEKGIHWRTDALYFQDTRRILIQLERTYSEDAASFNECFSTPYLIGVMMDHDLFDPIDVLPYAYRPWFLEEKDSALAESIFYGSSYPSLPVVLVSADESGQLPLDCSALAWRLKGAAHVLAFPEGGDHAWWMQSFSRQMPQSGMISVSYPNAEETIEYFSQEEEENSTALLNRICNRIFHYNLQLENAAMPAWMLLKARKLERSMGEETRRQQENEQQAAALFDEMSQDMLALSSQIRMLQAENNAMRQHLQAARSRNRADDASLTEAEFYPGEMEDMLLEACRLLRKNCTPQGRLGDLADAYLAGHAGSSEKEKRTALLREVFSGTQPDRRQLQKLAAAGFTIREEGSHYKLVYENDGRYTFSLSRTPSDRRAMKNSLSVILSKLFH